MDLLTSIILFFLWIFPCVCFLCYTYKHDITTEDWLYFELFLSFTLIPIFNWLFLYYFWKVFK